MGETVGGAFLRGGLKVGLSALGIWAASQLAELLGEEIWRQLEEEICNPIKSKIQEWGFDSDIECIWILISVLLTSILVIYIILKLLGVLPEGGTFWGSNL